MKKDFGLLGGKLGHSFSPLIHGCLGDYNYRLYEIPSGGLDAFMTARRFHGINVTIPYKQDVIPYCAALSKEARDTGSVNTIIKDADGRLHGHNTDYYGFTFMLGQAGIDPRGKKTLVLGDGGSARTVRAALAGLGAGETVTVSRRGENHYGNIARHEDAEIIVNTTPVGMYPGNGVSPVSLLGFKRLAGVADLIYNPARTRLLLDAEQMGIPHTNGLAMLVAQAEMASRLFLNGAADETQARDPARLEMAEKIQRTIRERTLNIVLIGMPGCGKSIAGQALAGSLIRPFTDIDKGIESAAGKSIPEILAADGEETFRRLETRVLGEAAKESGTVIATGGGVVTRPENIDLLRQNSVIVYLKRELSALATEGRPLSQSAGIETLAARRLPLYKAWSDYTVTVEKEPERTAAAVMEAVFK